MLQSISTGLSDEEKVGTSIESITASVVSVIDQ